LGYKKEDYIYELYGVCNHSGGLLGGHYTAYVKNSNAKWYHFNDTIVNEIEETQIISPKAYCLFYRKKSS
jgi:ubiquitin C-terminal hydrolase